MTERIQKLTELTLSGEMYVTPVSTKFDRMDMFLSEHERNAKEICEYILNQTPKITEYSSMTGFFNFDGSVVGDFFNNKGHKNAKETREKFYCQHIDNLSSMDWQHGTSDFRKVLKIGIRGIAREIEDAIPKHTETEKQEFLIALKRIADCLSDWMQKCSGVALDLSKTVTNPQYKSNLENLSVALSNISNNAPSNFYEAVLTIYVCFSLNPDSFGTLDRYLSDFYFNEIASGALTRGQAKTTLQELFLMVQAATPANSPNFTKGGQSHFCVGGRDRNGKDCYNELSELIIESLIELPTYIPEVTLRWTKDTPREVLKQVLLYERNDKNKRIAFTNDDKRLEAFTKICGFPYEEAVNYSLVGCNEVAMLGGMCASSSHANLVHSIEWVLHHRSADIINTKSFDEFYAVFLKQLYDDLDKIYYYDDWYNLQRAKDVNYVSCLLANGCIESGKSMTQGGVKYAVSGIMFLGNVTLIDSLSIIKQFVFDEKTISMLELVTALRADWNGYEDLRRVILKSGCFFGNDDETSNCVAQRVYQDLYKYVRIKKTVFGYPVLLGDHTGYPLHFKWFGENTAATPDGRHYGEPVSYGISQNNAKAKRGLTALMNAISKLDPHGISSSTVTNFMLDESYLRNDEIFDKTVVMLETYLRNGGIQFQLNYVSKEELLNAQVNPEQYKTLRVRVTGYSDFFTNLTEPVQDSIIRRYD